MNCMTNQKDEGEGVDTSKASDLVDGRGGAKDSVTTEGEAVEPGKKTVFVRDPAAAARRKALGEQ